MTRSVDDLAADVREAHAKAMESLAADVHPYSGPAVRDWEEQHEAALSELVALVGTLTQERDELRRLCSGYASDVDLYADELYKAGWSDPAAPLRHQDTARAESAVPGDRGEA